MNDKPLCTICMVLMACASPAFAQSGHQLVLQGNERYEAQDYEGAAGLFAQAAADPANAAARFNEGVALAQLNKLDEAAEALRDADRRAGPNDALANRARFNLGQVLFRQAKAAEQEKPEVALRLLSESAAVFRSCLDLNPKDTEAARNVEIVRRLMRDIQERQKQESQQQDKPEPQSGKDGAKAPTEQQQTPGEKANQQRKQAEELNKLAQQQEAAAEQSKQEAAKPQSQRSQEEQSRQEQAQQSISDQTEKAAQEAKGEAQTEELERAMSEQEKAAQSLSKNDPKGAEQHQREAAKQLREAAKQAEQAAEEAERQEASEQKDAAEQKDQQQAKDAKDEKPSYDQSAAQLLDRERRQRDAREQALRAMRGKPQPVERDW